MTIQRPSDGESLTKVVLDAKDIYVQACMRELKIPLEQVTWQMRQDMRRLVFARTYGARS